MLTWCAHGPPGAEVRAVEATEEVAVGVSGFRIG